MRIAKHHTTYWSDRIGRGGKRLSLYSRRKFKMVVRRTKKTHKTIRKLKKKRHSVKKL